MYLFYKNNCQRIMIAVLLSCVATFAPFAYSATADEQLTELLNEMQSLQAHFTQRILDAQGSRLQEISGTLSLSRPGRFHWQTYEPLPQTVVSDGETLWLFDPDLEQVTIQQVGEQQATPAMLLSGNLTQLRTRFDIRLIRDTPDMQEYLLIPIGHESLFEELRLSFQSRQLNALLLVDSLGQRTSIELSDLQLNDKIPEARFTFQIPAGVDVMRQ